jgi:hypothetical protein
VTGRPVSLHIGAHKTASTHLQKTFEHNVDLLSEHGIGWLGPVQLRREGKPLSRRLKAGFADILPEARRLVISEENLMGLQFSQVGSELLYPQAERRAGKLFDRMGGADVTVFLSVRDPAPWLASLYAHELFNGQVKPGFHSFLGSVRPAELRWAKLVRRLQIAGANRVVVWRQEDYSAVLPDLLPMMLGAALPIVPIENRVNASLSAEAIAMLESLGPDREDPRKTARQVKKAFPLRGPEDRFRPFSADTLAASAEAYADDLEALADLEDVTLLRP